MHLTGARTSPRPRLSVRPPQERVVQSLSRPCRQFRDASIAILIPPLSFVREGSPRPGVSKEIPDYHNEFNSRSIITCSPGVSKEIPDGHNEMISRSIITAGRVSPVSASQPPEPIRASAESSAASVASSTLGQFRHGRSASWFLGASPSQSDLRPTPDPLVVFEAGGLSSPRGL